MRGRLPAASTSSWSSGSPRPAARLVTSEMPSTSRPPPGRRSPRARWTSRPGRRRGCRPSGSRPGSRTAVRATGVDALGRSTDRSRGPGAQPGRVQIGEVDELGADERRRQVRLRWSRISTGSPTCTPDAQCRRTRWSGSTVRQPAAAATRTPCTTALDAATLVQMGATEKGEHPPPGDGDRPQPPGMALDRGRREAGQLGRRQCRRAAGPRASTAGTQPEPSTMATSCR